MNTKKIIQTLFTALILLTLFTTLVAAKKEITFTLEQNEYIFKVGENAVVPIAVDNEYREPISGTLQYTISQKVVQQGMQYSNTNTQSATYEIPAKEEGITLGFGTAEGPTEVDVKLLFKYTYDKEEYEIELDEFKIRFVKDEQEQPQQQQQQSQQEQGQEAKSQKTSDKQAQQQQQQEEQSVKPKQPESMSQQEQRLQNNQMSQDSSALKQQMQKEMQERAKQEEQLKNQIQNNEDFKKAEQELQDQGYQKKSENINPESNSTGSFEMEYENPNGDKASIKGDVNNNEIENMQVESDTKNKQALDQLKQDERFQEFNKELTNGGFNQTDIKYSNENNKTQIEATYTNQNNETATIKAELTPEEVEEVTLEKEKKGVNYWLLLPLILFAVAVIYLYNKIMKKNLNPNEDNTIEAPPVKTFDYIKEANNLLKTAQTQYNNNEAKDAFGTANQAIRLFLSYHHNIKKEVSNDDVIKFLKSNKQHYKELKKCFDLCSMVEFAKYKSSKKHFDDIIKYAKIVIKK